MDHPQQLTPIEEFKCYLESARAIGEVTHVVMHIDTARKIWSEEELVKMRNAGTLVHGPSGVEIELPFEEESEAGNE